DVCSSDLYLQELWCHFNLPTVGGSPTKVQFHDLTKVHTAGHTQRVEDHINRGTISEEWHVFHGQDLGDNTLVPVTASHLVAVSDFTFLGNVDTNKLVNTGWQFIIFVAVEDPYSDDGSGFTVWHLQRGVTDFLGLF